MDTTEDNAPTGLTRRRRRISDVETERRMLQAAAAMVHESGLTVSLEHISLEDVIHAAGVSRSAVYRRWPYKDLFFSDLLRQLAGAAGTGALPDDTATAELIRRVAAERLDWIATPEGRHDLLLELLRQSASANLSFFHQSTHWRTYLALHATFLSLPPGDLRDDVQAALSRSEQHVIGQIAASYERGATLLGYRLRPDLGAATYLDLATLLNATMRGMTLLAPTVPEIATDSVHATPYGAGAAREWSRPALAIAAITTSFLEPDPAVEWDEQRLATVREALDSLDLAATSQ